MGRFAEFLGLLSAIVLWRQAYRASLIKLGRAYFTPNPTAPGRYAELKRRIAKRLELREKDWTERDHMYLIIGLGLGVVESVIKLFFLRNLIAGY